MKNIILNASGGGTDNGYSSNGIVEKNYTLKLSKKIKSILESKGINVYLPRENDETISYDTRIKNIKEKYPNQDDTIIISNALNNEGSGIEIIYPLKRKDDLAEKLANSLSYFNDVKYYQQRWPTDTKKDYFYITRNTEGYNTIIIRYGNVFNETDRKVLNNNIDEIATSVADVLLNYIGYKDTEENKDYYIVKSGDTLYGIAKKYDVTVDQIKDLNKLNSNNLSINQKLLIPSKSNDNIDYYTVKSGDTLYSIAKKYNTTVDKLKDINNLTSNNLKVGDKLKLSDNTYIVKSGDTLYSIAKKFSTTVDELKKKNNLDTNKIIVGTTLYI